MKRTIKVNKITLKQLNQLQALGYTVAITGVKTHGNTIQSNTNAIDRNTDGSMYRSGSDSTSDTNTSVRNISEVKRDVFSYSID